MQTLIIYDLEGRIVFQGSGEVKEPTGIPFMWVEIPEGKFVDSIDISSSQPNFKDLPKNEVQELKEHTNLLESMIFETLELLALITSGGAE